MSGENLKSGHSRFLLHHFQFITPLCTVQSSHKQRRKEMPTNAHCFSKSHRATDLLVWASVSNDPFERSQQKWPTCPLLIYTLSRQTSWPFLRQFDANLSDWTAEREKQCNAEGAVLLWNTYCTEQEQWNNPEDESEISKINYCVGIWNWWLVKITNWINY
jgi:hypothetical protein